MDLHTVILGLSAIIVLLLLWGLIRVVNSPENSLDWSDLIASDRNGRQYADWNKIGQGLGVVLCTWLPLVYAYSPKMDAGGLALVLATALAYLGAVSGYSKYLRWKGGGGNERDTLGPDRRGDLHGAGGAGGVPSGGEEQRVGLSSGEEHGPG